MTEEFLWWHIFASRWMFPFYGGIFIFLGLRIENYWRTQKLDTEIERITNKIFIHRDSEPYSGETIRGQFSSLTNELSKIEEIKGIGILRAEIQSIEIETGDLKNIFSKNQRILRTIFKDFSQGRLKNRINLPGRTLILKSLGKDLILAINLANAKFPFGNVKR